MNRFSLFLLTIAFLFITIAPTVAQNDDTYFPLRVLRVTEDDDENLTLEWQLFETVEGFEDADIHWGGSDLIDLSIDVLLHDSRTNLGHPSYAKRTITCEVNEDGEGSLIEIHWDPFDFPFVYFTDDNYDFSHEYVDYQDFLFALNGAGHVDDYLNHHDSEVVQSCTEQLQDMIDDLRRKYGLPVAPSNPPAPSWTSGVDLEGGTIIRYLPTHGHYVTKIDIHHDNNTRNPTASAAFRPFNLHPMYPPPHNIVLSVNYEAVHSSTVPGEIFINYDTNHVFIQPTGTATLAYLLSVAQFSFISVLNGDGSKRYIAKVNHTDAFDFADGQYPDFVQGVRYRCDPQAKEGEFEQGEAVEFYFKRVPPAPADDTEGTTTD